MTTPWDMSLLLFSLFTAGTIYVVRGWEVQAVASEAVLEQNATLRCGLTGINTDPGNNPNSEPSGFLSIFEAAAQGQVERAEQEYFSLNFYTGEVVKNDVVNNRYTFDSQTLTMTIAAVVCSDEKSFECRMTVFPGAPKADSASFIVKAQPSAPDTMTTVPANLTGGVNELDSLTATCIANTGRENKGKIQWRVYRNNEEQIIDGEDVGNGVTVFNSQTSPQATEPSCTVRQSSRIVFSSLAVTDQNLVVTCFVLNDDFPSNPSNCDAPQSSLCQQSETIRIHYSVRDIAVQRVPDSDDIVEGKNVRLTCEALGFPEPRYEWSKVGSNDTLDSSGGSASELVLLNVGSEDSGNYSCTAINIVGGSSYRVQSDIKEINVVKPPPTTTPDPIETTDPTNPTGSPQTTDDSDDSTTIIIIVVVLVVAVVIAVIVGVCIYRKRQTKEDPPRPKEIPFYNNKQSMGGPPDVLGDDKKKPIGGTLNNSFDVKNEDGLMYADLTYDNRPRSRKPMAIGDTSSDYSDVQMPQV